MGAEETILNFLEGRPQGASISEIAESTSHTRATAAKYLEMMNIRGKVSFREVGKAKLWILKEKKKKILIAEDEANIRKLIKVILQSDYSVFDASNGLEALEKVSEEMPDLIILDVMMPKIDGIEVCRQLKKNVLTRKIPVIMLTAKREMNDKLTGIGAGAEDYLTKPFEPRELRERVTSFLQKSGIERNPVTNLLTMDYFLRKAKNNRSSEVFYVFFSNLSFYKGFYGLSKTNELIKLTSQIITSNTEKLGMNGFAGHADDSNFLIFTDGKNSKTLLKEISSEFDSTLPFFYDADYEDIDFKNKVLVKSDKGKDKKIPIVQLSIKKVEFSDLGKISEKLEMLRK